MYKLLDLGIGIAGIPLLELDYPLSAVLGILTMIAGYLKGGSDNKADKSVQCSQLCSLKSREWAWVLATVANHPIDSGSEKNQEAKGREEGNARASCDRHRDRDALVLLPPNSSYDQVDRHGRGLN